MPQTESFLNSNKVQGINQVFLYLKKNHNLHIKLKIFTIFRKILLWASFKKTKCTFLPTE